MTSALTERTVINYTPADRFDRWWCREGMAIVTAKGRALDTYWSCGGDQHVLTDEELATAEVLFHLDDFRELERYESHTWKEYHPQDRQVITSQHRLQKRLFVRHGATPDLGTKIANAREALREAESALETAQHRLQWRQEELQRLLDGGDQR